MRNTPKGYGTVVVTSCVEVADVIVTVDGNSVVMLVGVMVCVTTLCDYEGPGVSEGFLRCV